MIKTFGEILLRISPDFPAKSSGIYIGGAEANVCTALNHWGLPTACISKVPENEIGNSIITYLKQKNINTDLITKEGDRIGIYYLMQGADLQNASVVYDRSHSAFSQWQPEKTDWKALLNGSKWFHWSAITPALNANLAKASLEALKTAKELGLFISVDLNYRSKLWQYGKKPIDVMPELVHYCDLIMGNIWAANTMLGTPLVKEELNNDNKIGCNKAAIEAANQTFKYFPNCKQTAFTFRFTESAQTSLFATLVTKNKQLISSTYTSNNVADRVGSGDAFMAGLIYGNYNQWDEQKTLDIAAASAYCKWHISGDHTTATLNQIIETAKQHHETYTR